MMRVEFNSKLVEDNPSIQIGRMSVMVTPAVDEDFWMMRVPVSDKQAIVLFPKFGTFGIGFQDEGDDWNTNLPYKEKTQRIYDHIKNNKGDDSISDKTCLDAIRMLQNEIKGMV